MFEVVRYVVIVHTEYIMAFTSTGVRFVHYHLLDHAASAGKCHNYTNELLYCDVTV